MKKKLKNLVKSFSELCYRNKLCISGKEVLENAILGVDNLNEKIIITSYNSLKVQKQIFSIKQISRCFIKKVYRKIDAGDLKYKSLDEFVDKVILQIERTNVKEITEVTFYDKNKSIKSTLSSLEWKARVWAGYISNRNERLEVSECSS